VGKRYTADGTEWTVRKKGDAFHVVRVDRAEDREKQVASVHTSATHAGQAAAREGYRQGRQDAINEVRERLKQLETGDPGPLPADEVDGD
jgi:hypothetical protein